MQTIKNTTVTLTDNRNGVTVTVPAGRERAANNVAYLAATKFAADNNATLIGTYTDRIRIVSAGHTIGVVAINR